jgi:hypothetical protein
VANETHNPYSPPTANIEIDAQRNPTRIGLLLGAAFMLPFILFPIYGGFQLWFNGVAERTPHLLFLSLPILEGLYFGWWCGEASHKYSKLKLVAISVLQGACLLIVFMISVALLILFTKNYRYTFGFVFVQILLFLWLVFSIWSFFMAATIRWRIRKLQHMTLHSKE